MEQVSLSDGIVRVRVQVNDAFYYKMLSEMSGIPMESEYELIHTMKELAAMKEEYTKVQAALASVRGSGLRRGSPGALRDPDRGACGDPPGKQVRGKDQIQESVHPYDQSQYRNRDRAHCRNGTAGKRSDRIYWRKRKAGERASGRPIYRKIIEQLVQDGIRSKLAASAKKAR